VNRIFEILDSAPEIVDRAAVPVGSIAPNNAKGGTRIEFRDMSFGYTPARVVLKNLSLTIEAERLRRFLGQAIGKNHITEPSPSILRSEHRTDPTEWNRSPRIAIERPSARHCLRFPGTAPAPCHHCENISYGHPNATVEEIAHAARAAHADGFIERLPLKYETLVGEGATRLSVGEKQRINIARAFLKNAPLLLLDEPTSALDAETEAEVVESLKHLFQNRTTLMVAHRLSTIEAVDKIIVLEHGRVIEIGPPEELLKKNGYFKRVTQRSFGKV